MPRIKIKCVAIMAQNKLLYIVPHIVGKVKSATQLNVFLVETSVSFFNKRVSGTKLVNSLIQKVNLQDGVGIIFLNV